MGGVVREREMEEKAMVRREARGGGFESEQRSESGGVYIQRDNETEAVTTLRFRCGVDSVFQVTSSTCVLKRHLLHKVWLNKNLPTLKRMLTSCEDKSIIEICCSYTHTPPLPYEMGTFVKCT